jgi:hypothetical protein
LGTNNRRNTSAEARRRPLTRKNAMAERLDFGVRWNKVRRTYVEIDGIGPAGSGAAR